MLTAKTSKRLQTT